MAYQKDKGSQGVGLLFVVKDAQSIGSKPVQEKFAINSYVQRVRRERSKAAQNGRSTNPKEHSPEEVMSKANETASEKHRWRLQAYERGSRSSKVTAKRQGNDDGDKQVTVVTQISPGRKLSASSSSTDGEAYMQAFVYSPPPIVLKGNSDPFNSLVIPVSPKLNATVQAARRLAGFFIWPAESALAERSNIMREWWNEINVCMPEPDWCLSFATYSCALEAMFHEKDRASLVADGLTYKGESLTRLRNRMVNPLRDDITLSVIVHHFGAEFYSRDLFAAATHLKAARKITDRLGGLSTLKQHRKEILLTSDVVLACITVSRPMFDIPDWDPGFVEAAAKRLPGPDKAITRLTAAINQAKRSDAPLDLSIVDEELQSIFLGARELFHVEEYKNKLLAATGSVDEKIFRWLHLRKLAIWGVLLNLYIDVAQPVSLFGDTSPSRRTGPVSNPEDNYYIGLLCVAGIYAVANVFNYPGLPSTHARYRGILQVAFMTCLRRLGKDALLHGVYNRGALWALSMGVVDEVIHRSKEARTWHSALFAHWAWNMKLRTMEDVKECLAGFAYAENVLDGPLRTVVDNLEVWTLEASLLDIE